MARYSNRSVGNLLLFTFLILFLTGMYQGRRSLQEAFDVTLQGAQKNKPTNAHCDFDAECASDVCRAQTSEEGSRFTCQ